MNLSKFIEGLLILQKGCDRDPRGVVICSEHDRFFVCLVYKGFSVEDLEKLRNLGWTYEEYEGWSVNI